jgi:hypothetical protein
MRLLAALTLIVVLVFTGFFATTHGSSQPPHGDVDCDGDIDTVDALRILRHVAGLQILPQGCDLPPAPPAGFGLSRSNPVPMGQPFLVPEGWEITILEFIADATQIVLDENMFNDPPAPGRRYSIVRVRMKNVSAGNPADPDAGFALRMVGSQNIGYSTFRESCGVIPDDIDFKSGDIFAGGIIEGNVCYQTAIGETDFTIFTNFFLSPDENTRWFEVK